MNDVATGIWWDLLIGRLVQIRSSLTEDLFGIIQFEIARKGRPSSFRYLEIGAGIARGRTGIAPHFREWVHTTEEHLQNIVFSEAPVRGALTVRTSTGLFKRVIAHLNAAQPARTAGVWRGNS